MTILQKIAGANEVSPIQGYQDQFAENMALIGAPAAPKPCLDLDVDGLSFDDKAMALIVGSLALEAHYAATLRGVPSGTVVDQLPLVFSILNGHVGDLLDVRHVPTTDATCFASVVFCVSGEAYRRFADAAKNGKADAVHGDANV